MSTHSGIASKITHLWHLIIKEMAKFGVVGAVAFVVDNLTYAFLQMGMPGPGNGPLYGHLKISSAVATTVATLVSWLGNRYWTFRHKRNVNRGRELLLFGFFNVVGLAITVGCVMIAVDVLGLRGLGWETTARNVGIVLGTLFRFWTYRSFVFRKELDEDFGPLGSDSTPSHESGSSGPDGSAGPSGSAEEGADAGPTTTSPGDATSPAALTGSGGRRTSRALDGSRRRSGREARRRPVAVAQARDDSSASDRNRAKSTG